MGGLWSLIFGINPNRPLVVSRAKAARVLPSGASPKVDYDEEGRRLMESLSTSTDRLLLGVLTAVMGDAKPYNEYHDVDVMWKHPETGALLYVGNDRSARNDAFLTDLRVAGIVNCTRPSKYGQLNNYHMHTGRYSYFDVPVGHWREYCTQSATGQDLQRDEERFEATLRFLLPVFVFVLRALRQGRNVLVHCLAGAHRAGTMGVLLLMHLQGLTGDDAIRLAKKLRPVTDPISDFPKLIELYEKAARWRARNSGTAFAPAWNLPMSAAINTFGGAAEPLSSTPSTEFASYCAAKLNRSKSMHGGALIAAALTAELSDRIPPPSFANAQRRPSASGPGSLSAKHTPRETPRRKSLDPERETPRRRSVDLDRTPMDDSAGIAGGASSKGGDLGTAALASSFSAAYQSDVVGGSPNLRQSKKAYGPSHRRSFGPDDGSTAEILDAIATEVGGMQVKARVGGQRARGLRYSIG